MNNRSDSYWLDIAEKQYSRGQVDAAIDTLTRILGDNPDCGDAHALLAISLLKRKRVHAAMVEAGLATTLDPESLLAHLASAGICTAGRRFKEAEQHLLMARGLDAENATVHDHLARLYIAWDRDGDASASNHRACELAPDDVDHLALRSWLELRRGNRERAVRYARDALELDPENIEALCVLGHCDLASGNVEAARQHAAWALQVDPMNEEALALLGAIKARQSILLGAWWRFQSFVSAGSRVRAVALLIGIFLLYRIGLIALDENGMDHLLAPLTFAWMGFCLYTWVAPGLFWKSVRRELEQVRLRPNF